MAKAGMRRPDPEDPHGTESNKKTHFPKNDAGPVPEIQGKAKSGKEKAGLYQDSPGMRAENLKRDGKTPFPMDDMEVSTLDGGFTMTTSEILDFLEGTDSD
jgi:hypothetical protein